MNKLLNPVTILLIIILSAISLFVLLRVYIRYIKRKIAQAYEVISSQHKWLKVTLTSLGEGIITTDIDGCITFINLMAQELTGFSESEALGKQIDDVFIIKSKEKGNCVEDPFNNLTTENANVSSASDMVLVSKNGTEYIITNLAAPIRNTTGEIIGSVRVFQNVTEQKRAERLQHIIYRIAEATNRSTNLEALFRYIHMVLGSIIDTSNFYIALYDESLGHINFPYYVDENFQGKDLKAPVTRKNGKGLTEYIIRTGKSLLLDKDALISLVDAGEIEVTGPLPNVWLGTPLKAENKIIGVMAVQSYSESITYRQKDLEFMEYVSTQIAVAIERKKNEEIISHLAYHDSLTDMPNRALFNDRLKVSIAHAKRNDELLAILFLDLDRFKNVNDTLGHAIGDKLLKEVSLRLRKCLREGDTIARLGGDEFTILLPRLKSGKDAAKVAQKIIDNLLHPFNLDGYEFQITTSIGISIYPYDGKDAQSLLRNADAALYRAKEKGRNNYQMYSPFMNEAVFKGMIMESQLRQALKNQELRVYYQPQVSVASGQIVGMEALVRWDHPQKGIILPADFMPMAEETGLILQIDQWVMRTVCRQNAAWKKLGFTGKVFVNISNHQFQRTNLPSIIKSILDEEGLEPSYFGLEVTERAIMQNIEHSETALENLKSMGINIALDNFGTGFSSLSCLKRFPIDILKIDKSFVHDVTVDSDNKIITTAAIALAESMNRKVLAEGVETFEEFIFLKKNKCREIQGNLFCPPLPAHEIQKLLEAGTSFKV